MIGVGRNYACRLLACVAWVFLVCLASFPSGAIAQTDAYMLEEMEERDRLADLAIEEQTMTVREPSNSFQGPSVTRQEGQIGSARSATRGGQGGSTMLRYDQHRNLIPPASSTLRIGPWHTDLGVSSSAGFRYTRFSGAGVDFLDGTRRGDVQEEGAEFPLSATVTMNNYMLLTRRLDLSLNLRISYFYYPLETQPDQLEVDLTDEGVYATFSTQFHPTRDSRILVYDDIMYMTDFVDRRGISDRLGGREYSLFQNTLGADWDWRISRMGSLSASVSRSDTIPQSDEFDNQEAVRYAEMGAYRRQFNAFSAGGLLVKASQSIASSDDRPDSYIHGYSLFAGLNLTQTMDVNASIGQDFSEVRGGGAEGDRSQQSLTGAAALDHDLRFGRRQRFSAERAITESFEGGVDITDRFAYMFSWSEALFPGSFTSDYTLSDPQDFGRGKYSNWKNSIAVRMRLTRSLPLSITVSYDMRTNDEVEELEENPEDGVNENADYQTFSAVARTGFRLTEKMNFTAYVQHVQRTSEDPDQEYSRQTIGAQVAWAHQF